MLEISFIAGKAGRLDVVLASEVRGISRSKAAESARLGRVCVNGKNAKPSFAVSPGDVVRLQMPQLMPLQPQAEDIPLDTVYEDEYVVVVAKPRGMVVHPAAGNWNGTMVNALLHRLGSEFCQKGIRPGIVHRLDKDTSGLLMVAKTHEAKLELQQQLAARKTRREYLAIAIGVPKQLNGVVNLPIARHPVKRKQMAVVEGGRHAVTHYRVLENLGGFCLLGLRLETGRTHQIRVHMAALGHPILGDPVYGSKHYPNNIQKIEGQLLHAAMLGFKHPATGQWMEFEAEPPQVFEDILAKLRARHQGG